MQNAVNSTTNGTAIKRRKTTKEPIYLLDVIFISKSKVEVWYELFNQQRKTFIKVAELSRFVSNQAHGGLYVDCVKKNLLENIYELTEAYLIANKIGQPLPAASLAN